MKINDTSKKPTGLNGGPATGSASGANGAARTDAKITGGQTAGKSDTATGVSDSVHLSPQAQTLASQVSASGSFDAKKVEAIKTAISNGSFKVDPEKIATGLIDSVRDIISRR